MLMIVAQLLLRLEIIGYRTLAI